MKALSIVLTLFPVILNAVTTVENAIPLPGAGKQKLDLVLNVVKQAYDASADPAATINAAALGPKTLTQLGMQTGASGLAAPLNTGLTIGNATAAFTTGNGLTYVYIWYSIVTLQ